MSAKLRSFTWKWILVVLLPLVVVVALPPRLSAQTLTNADVLKMVQAKLGDAVIISKIKQAVNAIPFR